MIPWERFRTSVAEAETLARPEEFDAYQKLGEHYAGIRRWSPAFLAGVRIRRRAGVAPRSCAPSRCCARRTARKRPSLPKSAPTGFVRQRWAPHVLPGGAIDRRYYELCVLSELRDRLRAGDVWVAGSRQYRSFEERLISTETLAGAATDRNPADRGRSGFRELHRGSPCAAGRAAGRDRRPRQGRHCCRASRSTKAC